MYPITAELAELFANQRQVVKLTFDSVADNIVLTEADIKSGGLVIDRTCVSGDSIEIGSVIASELGVQLNNTSGQFNDVTLEGAECFVEVGTKDWSDEEAEVQYIPMGYFTVDGSPRKLDTISFKALDRMVKFDKAVDYTQLTFPMTVSALLSNICVICGVTLNTAYQSNWVNKTLSIAVAPEADNLTYRQLLSWICEIMGTCAYIGADGTLNVHWYGQAQSSTPSITAAVRYNSDVQENAITLTGVRIVTDANVYLAGTNTYALTIEGNPLIQSGYQTVANNIYNARGGMSYTPFTATVKSMPHLYPLDTVNFIKGESTIPSIITKANYALNNSTVLEGTGQTQIENDYAELNPMTTQQTVVLNRLHSKTVQEFKAADGEVLSTIANSQDKYDESASPGTITLRGYSTPADAGYAAAEHSGEYYLNETNGYVYLSNGTSWSKVAELTLKTTELDTKIDQTAAKISSEANARLEVTVGYSSKNWLDLNKYTYSSGISNVVIDEATGSLSFTGTGTNRGVNFFASDLGVEMYGKTYTVSCANNLASTTGGRLAIRKRTTNNIAKSVSFSTTGNKSITFTPDEETFPDGWYISVMGTGSTLETGYIDISQFMLRDGSIDDDTFEPYKSSVQTQIGETNTKIVQTAHGITQTVAAANAVEYIIPPGVIVSYHGYGFAVVDGQIDYTTTDTGISATGNTGKFFLDQSTGMLYVSDGNTWNNNNKQQLSDKFSEYSTSAQTTSEINQTASAISMEVVENTVGYSLTNDFTPVLQSATVNGLTLTKQPDGSYIANGTASGVAGFYISTADNQYSVSSPKYFTENGQYTIKATGSTSYAMTIYEDMTSKTYATTSDVVVTISDVATKTNCVYLAFLAGIYTNVVVKPVIHKGVTVEAQLNDTKTLIEQTADGILLSASQMISGKRTVNLIPFVYNVTSSASALVVNGVKIHSVNGGYYINRVSSDSNDAAFTVYTADCNTAFNNPKLADTKTLPTGKYIISGRGFSDDVQYRIEYSRNGSTGTKVVYFGENNDTSEKTFEITDNMGDYVRHYIWVRSSASPDGAVFPMIRDATITDSTYAPGMDAGAYMCSAINITPERLELDSGKLIINSGNFQLDGNGVVTSTAGTFKSGNYAPATQSAKTVGGQLDLDASGSDLIVDTANFKVSGNGAVSAEDATFTNCTIEGGSFEVDSTEQSGQVTSKIHFSNSYLGDSETIEISSEKIKMSRTNTGGSRNILLDYDNNIGSELKLETQAASTWDKALYSASKIKFDTRTSPTASITYVDANSNERNALVFGGSPSTVTLGDKNTYNKILGTQTFISSIDSNNVERTAFSYIGSAVGIGNPNIPVSLTGSSITANGKKLISDIKTNPAATLPITLTDAYAGNVVDWIIDGNADGVGQRTKNLVDLSNVTDSTSNGVTFTVDSTNGTITANRTGTSTANASKSFTMTLPAGTYVFSCGENPQRDVTYDSYLRIGGASTSTIARDNPDDPPGSEFTLTTETTFVVYLRIQPRYDAQNLVFKPMIRPADTSPEFIPYGYQVPITISQTGQTDKTYDIFIGDSPLTEGQSVSSMSTGQDIGLFEGENTITTTLTNKPKMTIKYFTT